MTGRQTIVQQDGVETLHQRRTTLKQETGLPSLPMGPEQSSYQAETYYLFIYLFIYLFTHLLTYLLIYLLIYLLYFLFIYLFIYLFTYLFTYLLIYLFIIIRCLLPGLQRARTASKLTVMKERN